MVDRGSAKLTIVTDDGNQRPDGELRLENGRRLHLAGSGTSITVGERVLAHAPGSVYRVVDASGTEHALVWLDSQSRDWQLDQARLLCRTGIVHAAFCWPIDLVLDDELNERGILLPLVEGRFETLSKFLHRSDLTFDLRLTVTSELADALGKLHHTGLCFPGLDSGVYADPQSGDIALIGWEAVSDGTRYFLGNPTVMAPELTKGEELPSPYTDNHALAVHLFLIFMRGHPLDHELELDDPEFPPDPVFVFDPADASHRPPPDPLVVTWWHMYPKFFQEHFIQTFTVGLSDPPRRVSPDEWRDVINRLRSYSGECECGALVFYDPQEPQKTCWRCEATLGLGSGD